jgi:hypothetical protein
MDGLKERYGSRSLTKATNLNGPGKRRD